MISQLDRQVLGFALQLSASCHVEAVAIANGPFVYHLRLAGSSGPSQTHFGELLDILDGRYGVLSGFNMARMALHVQRDIGLECSGVELGNILPTSGQRLSSPSEVVHKRISSKVNAMEVDGLWHNGSANAVENTCLRAWLSGQ